MHAVIFEPIHAGHRLTYVRLIAEALLDLPTRVSIVVGQDAPASDEFRAQIAALGERCRIEPVLPAFRKGMIVSALDRRRSLLDTMRRLRPEALYVPYADGLAQVLGATQWPFTRPWSADTLAESLMMRGRFAYPTAGVKQQAMRRAGLLALSRSPWSRVHWIDPLAMQAIERRGGRLARVSGLMPDPVEPATTVERGEARRRLGAPEEGRCIALAGGLDERKGADLLLRAFAAARLPGDARLLLVGRLSPGVRAVLESDALAGVRRAGRVATLDRYVTQEELNLTFAAADVVCTPYPDHIGSASIVIRAAAAGRPVVASDTGWMGHVVPRFGLGWTCRAGDVEALALALEQALPGSEGFALGEAGRRFVTYHSIANFAAHWTAGLRSRLGMPASAALRPWSWVTAGQ